MQRIERPASSYPPSNFAPLGECDTPSTETVTSVRCWSLSGSWWRRSTGTSVVVSAYFGVVESLHQQHLPAFALTSDKSAFVASIVLERLIDWWAGGAAADEPAP